MPGHDIIVIGASAGGSDALSRICEALPEDFPAAVFIVWHVPARAPGLLPHIIGHHAHLPVNFALNGEAILSGRIYVAPPDYHLLLEHDRVRLTQGPKENRFRPAIDPLFRSAAYVFGPRVIGVVLTGSLDDGTSGLWAIKDRGGVAIVQDPEDAQFPDMPRNALQQVAVDYRVPLLEIPSLLVKLTAEPVRIPPHNDDERDALDIQSATLDRVTEEDMHKLGAVSQFSCPECHGVLWRIPEGKVMRFRCRTGHAYTVESLLADLSELTEETLWSAVRCLEERGSLLQSMSEQQRERGDRQTAETYELEAEADQRRAQMLRLMLNGSGESSVAG
jgi:two-component system chemotaxis response regulator CheB